MNAERFAESAQPLNKVLQPHRVVEEDAEGARPERSLSRAKLGAEFEWSRRNIIKSFWVRRQGARHRLP